MWYEPLLILGIGATVSLGLYVYYQPKINKMKKSYKKFSSKIRENLINMSEDERKEFLSNMSTETQSFFEGILNGDFSFHGIDEFHTFHHHLQHVEQVHQQQFQDFSRWAMEEGLRSVMPFDAGGYVQGPGFNPSDTFAHDSMNHSMDMNSGMDSFNGF